MANLVDSSVNGDLRVTGTMFGTQAGNYATCATAAGTAAKAVTISGFTLTTGIHVFVKFTVTNTAAVASLTLNVSGTGAKAMKYRGGNLPAVGTLSANRVYEFIYDGTNWELVGDLDTNTQTVTGVKGNAESSYRTGNVNLTAANVGAANTSLSNITDTAFCAMLPNSWGRGTFTNIATGYALLATISTASMSDNSDVHTVFHIQYLQDASDNFLGEQKLCIDCRHGSGTNYAYNAHILNYYTNSANIAIKVYRTDNSDIRVYGVITSGSGKYQGAICHLISCTGWGGESFLDRVTLTKGAATSTAPTGTEITVTAVTPFAASSHAHGNIANGGTLTDTAAAAAGNDYVVIRDADNAKIQTSTIKGTDVADAVSKKHSHSTLTLSTTAQAYDGTHTLALPSSDPYTSARTPTSHTHGNIANGGTLTDTAAAAAGNDYVVIRDADNSKIQTSTIKGTDVADAVSKKHSHSTLTLSTTAQAYDGSHTLALPSTDPYTSARTPTSHTHGNITNGGALQTNDITIANGDKLVVTDSSDSSKVARTSVSFDGSTTTTALTPKGTFEAFAKSGDISTAIGNLDAEKTSTDGTNVQVKVTEADGKISAVNITTDTTANRNEGVYYVAGTTDYPAWVANHAYAVNDNAISGGKAYFCKTAHTSGSSFDSSKWTAIVTPVIKGTITGVTALYTGIKIALKWPITGGSSSTYLNINGLGNVYIRRNDGNITTHLPANSVSFLAYDGTYWRWADYDSNTNNWVTTMGAYCDTAAGTQAKVATSTSTVYTAGESFLIRIVNANTYNGKITLNINSQGAKDVWINGAVSSSSNKTLPAGEHWCHYDGSVFHIWTDGTAQFTKLKAGTFTGNVTGDVTGNATTATKLGTADKGSATKPIYLAAGTPTECTTYAGGTAVTLNNSSKAGSTASFYAPTAGGTANYVLIGNGTTSAPTWAEKAPKASTADTAAKIATSAKIGDTNKPVYIAADGTVTAINYTIATSVPSGAVFTDTKQNITLATTTKAFITGVSTTPTSTAQALTGLADTGVYLTTTAGQLHATTFDVNSKCTLQFDSTNDALDFMFA